MLKTLWHAKFPASRFEKCENGAVTVDWVVLCAAIVIFGSVMIGIYRGGVYNVATAISEKVVADKPTLADSPWK